MPRNRRHHNATSFKEVHVIDPANEINKVMDVTITAWKIAVVAEAIPAIEAGKVVDVSGMYVTPDFIDIRVHAFLWESLSVLVCS